MPDQPPADPLEKTKMSFFSHLEELRLALFKSLLALAIGTLLGLLFGQATVDYIQTPLRNSLETFYRDQAQTQNQQVLESRHTAGETVPENLAAAAEKLAKEGLVPHSLYIAPRELARVLGQAPPAEDAPFATTRDDMVHLRLFLPLEQDPRLKLISLSGQGPFLVYVKASLVVGAMIASPFIFFFIWEFVAAGLYQHERKYIYIFLPMSLGLFFAGAALAFLCSTTSSIFCFGSTPKWVSTRRQRSVSG